MRPSAALLGAGLATLLGTLLAACGKPAAAPSVSDEPDIRIGLVVGASDARVAGQGTLGGVVRGNVAFRVSAGTEVLALLDFEIANIGDSCPKLFII